jgi:hypothetical protein
VIVECELKIDGNWSTIDISEALRLRRSNPGKMMLFRCPDCHGRLRAHPTYNSGTRAHFEHLRENIGCQLSAKFRHPAKRHPEPLD